MPIKLIAPNKRSPNYRARGTHAEKTRWSTYVDRSLGTANRATAKDRLAKLCAEIESGEFSKTAEPVRPTFASAAVAYNRSGGEKRFLGRIVAHFQDRPLADITQAAIDEAAIALYPEAPAATRNRQVYSPISAVLHHAGVALALKRPQGSRGASRLHWLRPEQLFALLAAADEMEPRFGALLTFLAYCGPRLSEALRLEWADVDLAASHAFIRQTKNGNPQGVYLPPVVVAALANLERPAARVFRYAKTGRLYLKLAEAERRSGVAIPDGIAFHIFRHTYGALMRRHGKLDTAGLVATGRWKSRQAAAVYEHVEASEEAVRADLLPTRVKAV